MDKIKPYLAILKKYHFWILFAVVAIVAVVVRQQAGSSLSQLTQTQESKLKNSFSQMQQLAGETGPKTTKHAEVWIKGLGELKKNEEEGYEILREPLTQQAPFKWPKLKNNKLPGFMETAGPKDQIPDKLREEYENYMKNELRHVLAAGNVIRKVRTDGGPFDNEDEDVAASAPTEEQGVVEWLLADREEFEKRYQFSDVPTTEQIKILQEDYWLFESLLKSIAAVNQNSKGPYDAVVSKINVLTIAQRALERQIQAMPALTAPGKDGGVAGTNVGVAARKAPPSVPALHASAAELEKNRYVDEQGAPLANKAATKLPEFTFVPVYLELVMHQQKIPDLVTTLRNSVLPVHVTRFAISDATGGSGSGSSSSSESVSRPASGGGGGLESLAKGGARSQSTQTTTSRTEKKPLKRPNDVLVQLSGVLMMVNPPVVKPGTPGAPAGQPVAGAAAAPASAAPVPGA